MWFEIWLSKPTENFSKRTENFKSHPAAPRVISLFPCALKNFPCALSQISNHTSPQGDVCPTNHSQNPQLDTLGTFFGPQKVIFGHFVKFAYFYLVFQLARVVFFKCKRTTEGVLKSKSWRKQTSFRIKFPIQFQLCKSWSQFLIFHRALMSSLL